MKLSSNSVLAVALTLAVSVAGVQAQPAAAASHKQADVVSDPSSPGYDVLGALTEEARKRTSGGGRADDSRGRPVQVRRYEPVCRSVHGTQNEVAACQRSNSQCSRALGRKAVGVWALVGPEGNANPGPGEWTNAGRECRAVREPREVAEAGLTLREFRRLPIPAGAMRLEPSDRPVLVNVPTNAYVEAKPVRLTTTVVGLRVEVIATPVRYEWAFGDGGTLSTTDPGGPYPVLRTAHTYTSTGTFQVTLSTVYSGRYRVLGRGGGWIPVDGTASVPSRATSVEVIETRAVLVP